LSSSPGYSACANVSNDSAALSSLAFSQYFPHKHT
jgi:hypothetical protein